MNIKFACPGCGSPISAPDDATGKKGKCPKCSGTFLIPSSVASGSSANGDNLDDTEESEGYPLWLKILAATAAVLVVVLPLYVFWPKDKWEQNHKDDITALARDAASLEKGGKYKEAISRCDQLLVLVGDRKLRDENLAQAVSQARQVKEQSQEAAARVVRDAQALKEQAEAFVHAGDLQSALSRYDQLLDYVQKARPSDPALDILASIAVAEKKNTQEKINIRTAVERQRQKEEELQRREKAYEEIERSMKRTAGAVIGEVLYKSYKGEEELANSIEALRDPPESAYSRAVREDRHYHQFLQEHKEDLKGEALIMFLKLLSDEKSRRP
jgi:tetratricopeptide (TPR) repeat protein